MTSDHFTHEKDAIFLIRNVPHESLRLIIANPSLLHSAVSAMDEGDISTNENIAETLPAVCPHNPHNPRNLTPCRNRGISSPVTCSANDNRNQSHPYSCYPNHLVHDSFGIRWL
jgi:hypothetical protein